VVECLEVLKGRGPTDLVDLSVELAARMLVLGGVAGNRSEAQQKVRGAIASGAGLERFRRIIEQQGGDPHVVDDYGRIAAAPERDVVRAPRQGFLAGLDAALVGRASVALGAGRDRVEDSIDHAAGITVVVKPGVELRAGDPVLELHYRDRARLGAAADLASRAIKIEDNQPIVEPLVVGEVR
jgi:thymidine phosphorylase